MSPDPIASAAADAALEETEMAALAARFVNSTQRHVFLTGKAGTGKTTFLHRLAATTHKRYLVLAPTGIAALNARGVTLHSQFQLPFGAFVPERHLPADLGEYGAYIDQHTLASRHAMNALRRAVLREVDLLVIDEVSMLRADLLDAVDQRMRSAKGSARSFGGAQLLLIGDLFQLPPVVKDSEREVMRRWYPSMHFFSSRALQQEGYVHIELDRIFRQHDDRFIAILNNLRNNTVTAADVDALNAHLRAPGEAGAEEVITLTTHNARADAINQQALDRLPGRPHTFDAEVEDDFPESMFPVLRRIELKEGARIMFTRNDPDKAYFNGRLATVERIDAKGVEVRMDGDHAPYTLQREVWENIRYTVDDATKAQREEVIGTFAQYPVKLAWAITVHKSQGLTFDRAVIDVGQAFAPGQVYVALSRLRTLEGLILRTPIDPAVVSTDPEVAAFQDRGFRQPPLAEQLRTRQIEYLRDMLLSSFHFGDLEKRIGFAQKDHNEKSEFEDESMRSALTVLLERLRNEEENTRKFRDQLQRLLITGDTAALIERIAKGTAYYTDLLFEAMEHLLRHLVLVEGLARTKQYAEALRGIDGMLMKRVSDLSKAAHVARCILNDLPVDRQPEREKALLARRTALVEAVRGALRGAASATRNATGRVRKRKPEGAGAKREKGATYQVTYDLHRQGLSPEAIAQQRGMSLSTIEGHLARGIAAGAVRIEDLMPAEERDAIADRLREDPAGGLNAARRDLGDRSSFGRLRMVQAWLKKEA